MNLLVLNGPNINMIGIREPDIYGTDTYQDLVETICDYCDGIHNVDFIQSNHEGELVDAIQAAYQKYDGIIFNPAAYTHTSIALLDALKAVNVKCIEVHLSDISKREAYRQQSYIREACVTTISGEGIQGYISAIQHLEKEDNNDNNNEKNGSRGRSK